MKKKTGLVLMVIVLAVSLFSSLGLISASADNGTLPPTNQAGNTIYKMATLPPVNGDIANVPVCVTIDFEGLQDTYPYTGFFAFYPGVTFGPTIILDAGAYGYDYSGFPPHSGQAVFSGCGDSPVDIVFDLPCSYVEGWFGFGDAWGYMEAYDALGNLVGQASCAPNYGFSDKMWVAGTGIKKVTLFGGNGFWVGDDIAYQVDPEPVPGASQWGIVVLAVLFSGAMVWIMRRRRIRNYTQ
jgi:hypothetical protein